MSDETPNPADPKPPTTRGDTAPATAPTAPDVEVVPAAAEPVPVTADPTVGAAEPIAAGPTPAEPTPAEPTPAEPTAAEPTAEPTATAEPTDDPAHRVVYVETPTPPRVRGNRVVGTLLALVGAAVYAGLFAVVGGLLYFVAGHELFGVEFRAFVSSAAFWVPILVFVLAFILEVVIVNRGGWAAHVFGSLLLAFVVYFASIGLLLLVGNVLSQQHVTFAQIALTPQIIAAAVIAREVAIWLGLAIARRGRSVRARNADARTKYDAELAEQRARFTRPAPGADV